MTAAEHVEQPTPSQRMGIWMLRWRNPYQPRPEGWPEIMLRIAIPLAKGQGAGRCPEEINEAWEELSPYGYGVSWHLEAPPARQLPIESKQRIRRRNLWKRLLKKYPMFLSDYYADAVQARPEYYGPYTAGEFADLVFVRTTLGSLKMVKEGTL